MYEYDCSNDCFITALYSNKAWTILYLRFRQIKKRDLVHFVVACFVLCGLSVYGTAKLLSIVIRHGLLNT